MQSRWSSALRATTRSFPSPFQSSPELVLSLDIGIALRLSSDHIEPVIKNLTDSSFTPDTRAIRREFSSLHHRDVRLRLTMAE